MPWHGGCEEARDSKPDPPIMKSKSLHDLLITEIKDLYSAENQLVKALPKMAKAASSDKLRQGFLDHLEQTKVHVERLEAVAESLEASPRGKACKAMAGLIEEGAEVMKEDLPESVLDAALIAAAQKVEHYEIASYGTARTFAEVLGLEEVAATLQLTLDEEGETDEKLTKLAKSINVAAEHAALV